MNQASPTWIAAGVATIAATLLATTIAALPSTAGASAAAITVKTYAASPPAVSLGSGPKCAVLRYKLSAGAQDVDLKIVDSGNHEVWEAERKTSGVAAAVVYRFTWCGRARSGGTVAPGAYRWSVEAEQAATHAEARSPWRTITVKR